MAMLPLRLKAIRFQSRRVEANVNSIYLLLGSESALADRALTKILAEVRQEQAEVTSIFANEVAPGDISDALSPSLFSERRALVIRDLQDLTEEGKSELVTLLEDLDPTITLILLHKGGVKGKALLDQIKKLKPEVISCEPLKKESEKEEFLRNLFLDSGRKPTPGAITALMSAMGNDLAELTSAVSQLISDTAGAIDEAAVNKYHQGRVETTGFDVADAVLTGPTPAALLVLRQALATGTDPVMVTSAIASSLRSLAKVSGVSRGAKSFELAGQLGMAPWQIDKARRQLNVWPPAAIARAVKAIAVADAEVKGAATDPIYALERALAEIGAARS
jgi:DNA polymerase-3 subunit delta